MATKCVTGKVRFSYVNIFKSRSFREGQEAKYSICLLIPKSDEKTVRKIRKAIDEAVKCRASGEAKTILFGLTGTGYFDMTAYQSFNDHTMGDCIPTDEELAASFARLPKVG